MNLNMSFKKSVLGLEIIYTAPLLGVKAHKKELELWECPLNIMTKNFFKGLKNGSLVFTLLTFSAGLS